MSNELKPCPFCGTEPKMRALMGQTFRGNCSNEDCEAATAFFDTEEEAVEAWNRRADLCEPQWIYPSRGGALPDAQLDSWIVTLGQPGRVKEAFWAPWEDSFCGESTYYGPSEILCWMPRLTPAPPSEVMPQGGSDANK